VDETAVNGQVETDQRAQRISQAAIGQLVSNLSALSNARYQPTPAQARQVIGDIRPAGAEGVGQIGRIRGSIHQYGQDAPSGGVGQGCSDSIQGVEVW